jgi:alanine dehydrogenase
MKIGIPRERRDLELRVGLTPHGVELLAAAGHQCYVESQAGLGAGFADEVYERAGGSIVYSGEEVFGRADLVLKVVRPTAEEADWLREGQIVAAFMHLAAARHGCVEALLEKRITAIAYETIEEDGGRLPVLRTMSEVAGRMAPQLAATYLQSDNGGRGVLLGGVPGIPAATVAIVGAGVLGANAARAFLGLGARVVCLDRSQERLREIDLMFEGQVTTMVSYPFNIARAARSAEVLVGSILASGASAPIVVTREMVRSMKWGSVVLDFSIDQGGCVETSRPTTLRDPTFVEEGVVHFCVPNVPGIVPRTATHAFNNAVWPYIWHISRVGLDEAVAALPALARGVAIREGAVVNEALGAAHYAWDGERSDAVG